MFVFHQIMMSLKLLLLHLDCRLLELTQIISALPVRSTTHPRRLRSELPPAEERGQGGGQGEADHDEDPGHEGEVGGEPLLVCGEGHHDVSVDGEESESVAAAEAWRLC